MALNAVPVTSTAKASGLEVLPWRRRKRCTRGPGGCGGTTPGGRRADACLWRSLRRDSRRTWNGREAEIKTLLWLDRIGEGGIRTHDVLINRRLLYHSVENLSSKINWGRRFLSLELWLEPGRLKTSTGNIVKILNWSRAYVFKC